MESKISLYKKVDEVLWQATYELTWAGLLWGKCGAIKLSEMRYEVLCELGQRREAMSSLLSTYYTAWGNAGAKMSWSSFPEWPAWVWRAIKYRAKAKKLAYQLDFLIKLTPPISEPGLADFMILGRVLFRLKEYESAVNYYQCALAMGGHSKDNRALISAEMGEALVYAKSSDGMPLLQSALDMLKEVDDPKTKVRIYKTMAAVKLFVAKNGKSTWSDIDIFTLNYETPLTPPLLDQGGDGGGNFKFRNYPTSILPLFKGRRNTSFVIQSI